MPEDPMAKVEQTIRKEFQGLAGIVADDPYRGSIERRRMGNLAPILTHFSNKRQEQILIDQHEVLKQMKTQSDTMTKHSKIMIVLTFVILAAMGLQIIIQLCK